MSVRYNQKHTEGFAVEKKEGKQNQNQGKFKKLILHVLLLLL